MKENIISFINHNKWLKFLTLLVDFCHLPPPVSSQFQDMHNHFTTDSLQYWTMFDYYVQMQESWSAPGEQGQNLFEVPV